MITDKPAHPGPTEEQSEKTDNKKSPSQMTVTGKNNIAKV